MGCPHRCSFCNQKTISGRTVPPTEADIEKAVTTALNSSDCNEGEIAFFGGSFTAVEREYMISLLKKAKEYVDKGLFKGIRISTRPDCIDEEILEILRFYGVTSIEIGCQSMDDNVLMLNSRGHSCEDIINAAKKIRSFGFEFGVQMMTGLLGDSDEGAIRTAEKLIALKPDTARIYPTVVLEGTFLEKLYLEGRYKPQKLEDAAQLCARLLMMFHKADIPVIRLGLHSGGNVEEGFVAGVYHPAFREICESKIYLKLITDEITKHEIKPGNIEITVGRRYVSQLLGQKKSNLNKLREAGYNIKVLQNDFDKYKVKVCEVKSL